MPSYNKVILMGHLTRDPEMKYTPNGQAVAKIGLAVNRKWKNQAGEAQEDVTFVDCDAWGKTAELINQYCRKGDPLHIEGRLKLDQWQDQQGQKRSKLCVVIESMQFLGGRQDDRQNQQQQNRQQSAYQAPPQQGMGDEDIPF